MVCLSEPLLGSKSALSSEQSEVVSVSTTLDFDGTKVTKRGQT